MKTWYSERRLSTQVYSECIDYSLIPNEGLKLRTLLKRLKKNNNQFQKSFLFSIACPIFHAYLPSPIKDIPHVCTVWNFQCGSAIKATA